MPPKSVLVFAKGSRSLKKSPFWEGFKAKVERTKRGKFVEVNDLEKDIDFINQTLDESLRRGELAALVGLRLSRGRGDWSQIRHFTPARHSARLSRYVIGQLRQARVPETVLRFNAEYGPTDVQRSKEAQRYVTAASSTRHRVAPLMVLPWFEDNRKQHEVLMADAQAARVFGAVMAGGIVHFIERWS